MSQITVEGKFKNSNNNFVIMEIYSPNPQGFDFKRTYNENFKEQLKNLEAGVTYILDITGHTTGSFNLKVSGDIVGTPSISASGVINDSISFTTK